MIKKYLVAGVLGISLIGALLWMLHDSSTNFHKKLLKHEAQFRDSIIKNIVTLRTERDVLQAEINLLHDEIKAQTAELKESIKRIKITVNVPPVDYSKFSDTALVNRLLSDYSGR